jgi:cation diffusion facilitator family transporter
MDSSTTQSQAINVTLIGMALDLFLAGLKIIGGTLTQSFALVTDGIHSLTDAITDIFVLLMARFAHAAPDEEHPYGHGRFETLGTIGMGVVFFSTAAILLYDGYQRLQNTEDLPVPAAAGLGIALLSIAGKEWIFHYTMRVAKRLNSNLLKANAWHSRSDAISSVAVLIGLIGAQQGYLWMDTLAAIFVACVIATIGWELCMDSLKELVDTSIPKQRRQQIQHCIMAVDGILGVTRLRSRSSGGKIILEVQLLVNPRISVSEGHQLGEIVSRSLTGNFSDVGDVIVHIDPETHNHDKALHDMELLGRENVLESVKERWQDLLTEEQIEEVSLHFLERGIEVDLTLRQAQISDALAQQLAAALEPLQAIASVRIYNKLHEASINEQLP